MEKTKKLPNKIEQDLNRNTMFNTFGLVNIKDISSKHNTATQTGRKH